MTLNGEMAFIVGLILGLGLELELGLWFRLGRNVWEGKCLGEISNTPKSLVICLSFNSSSSSKSDNVLQT